MFYREEKKLKPIKKLPLLKNMEQVETHDTLLNDKKRQELIKSITDNLLFKTNEHKQFIQPLIEKIAVFFQQLPDTSLYYSQRGGLLDRALNRAEAALNLMQQLLVRKDSDSPSEEQKLWLYVVFSAGLLQGIGKLYGEYSVSLFDREGQFLQLWQPLHEDIPNLASYYKHEFTPNGDENARKHITLLLATRLMPTEGLVKITANPKLFYAWLALLEGDRDGAGSLSAILDRADAIALQNYLQLFLDEHKHLLEQNNRVGTFLDMPSEQPVVDREQVLGAEFLLWVRDGLSAGKFLLNKPPMQASVSAAGVEISSEVFDMFVQEHQKFKNKPMLQRAFLNWTKHLNLKNSDKQQLLTKVTLDQALLPNSVKIYSTKTNHISTVNTLNLLHDLQAYSVEYDRVPIPIQQLNTNGTWVHVDDTPTVTLGRSPGG